MLTSRYDEYNDCAGRASHRENATGANLAFRDRVQGHNDPIRTDTLI